MLTSTGYGDMLPVYPLARSLAHLEAVVGQLFLAIFLARLVSLRGRSAERISREIRPSGRARPPTGRVPAGAPDYAGASDVGLPQSAQRSFYHPNQ